MNKILLVTKYEFRRLTRSKNFIIVTLIFPVLLVLIFGLVAILESNNKDMTPVGYVDHSVFLNDPVPAPKRKANIANPSIPELIPLIPYDSEESAKADLDKDKIQAYYIIPENYRETKDVQLVYHSYPSDNARRQFWDFMQINWLREIQFEKAKRAVADADIVIHKPSGGVGGYRVFSSSNFLNQVLPLILFMAIIILMITTASSFMETIVVEKENRTLEILMTAISPFRLIMGKIMGTFLVIITQALLWVIIVGAGIGILGGIFDIHVVTSFEIEWKVMTPIIIMAIPTLLMVGGILSIFGISMDDPQKARQMIIMFVYPFMIPVWFMKVFITNPDSLISDILYYFPVTTFTTFCIRLAFFQVSWGEFFLALGLLSLCAFLLIWAAVGLFKLWIRRCGKSISMKKLLKREKV